MKRIIIYFLVLVAIASHVVAQGVVEGVVSDSRTAAHLEMVNVGVVGTVTGTTTDSRGYYKLKISSSDSIIVRFSYTGYESREYRLKVAGVLKLNVDLKQTARSLEAVEVSDEKTRQSSFTQIDVQKLDDAVGPGSGVESLLKTLPDVNSSNELSSQYSVRGGSFDENLVYINGVEVFRPMLIRSGQQEGMSIINPDLVDYILFSPGGFDASYGDKMSSVLDIIYSRPRDFGGKVSMSLLGGSATVQGRVGERWSYAAGLRRHSNSYILSSLDTRGSYTTSYTDFQTVIGYKASDKLDIGFVGMVSRNVYGLVPDSMTTAFGQRSFELDVYFDGAEEDRYRTLLGAVTFDYHPNDDWRLNGNAGVQHISENERYDVQSQYFLYMLTMGAEVGEVEKFDLGVGTFLEHARNRLTTDIATADVRVTRQLRLGSFQGGLKLQLERVNDRLREWRMVDSAGYALPYTAPQPGDSGAVPQTPILQDYANASGGVGTVRATAFIQRELNFMLSDGAELRLLAGIRGGLYNSRLEWYDEEESTGLKATVGPRVSASLKPRWKKDILFRLAGGVYQQAPFYREYRRVDGTLNPEVGPQTSYQATVTADWNLRAWERPFKITADVYYKYVTDLVPYTVDNLRISYHPDERALAYAAGFSLRINGEFVEGLESWASVSLMRTQEDIEGDAFGWLDRPTDQRFSFKMFLQDYIPDMPWWKMSLSMIYATGMPITAPYGRQEEALRLPSYLRIDWGNTVQLSRFERMKRWKVFRYVDDVQVGVEVFNLFDIRNVISYLWVTDYTGSPYRVPNYLTARQLNLKLTVLF